VTRSPGRIELGLLVLALTFRLGWALAAGTDLWMDHVFNDATAVSLAEGRGFTAAAEGEPHDPAVFRTPGYPAFAAGVYLLAGHSVRAVFVAQAVLDVLSCLILWRLAVRRLGGRTACFVLFLAATYPFSVYAVGTFSPETLLVFLGLLLVAVVDSWRERGDAARVVAAGVLGAALAWVKPVFLPLPLFLVLTERLRGRTWRLSLVRPVAVGAVTLLLFAPWVIRNALAFDRLVLAGEAGLVVWHGTYDFEERRDAMIESRFAADDAKGEDRYEVTRKRFTDSASLLESDRDFLRRGLARIRERPLKGLLLDPLRRVPRLWVSTSFVGGPSWFGLLAAAGCVGYLLLGAVGLVCLRGRIRGLSAFWTLPLLLTAVYAAVHVEARYTLPARPSLLLLGGAGLTWLLGKVLLRGRSTEE
jgi:hypothetical protein